MDTTSLWADSARLPRFEKITEDCRVDVAIVGGGITGITAAYLFHRAGCKVALVERGSLGGFDTANTTAHITCLPDGRLKQLCRRLGIEGARSVWDAGQAATDCIYNNIRTIGIDCGFKWVPVFLHASLMGNPRSVQKSLEQDARVAKRMDIFANLIPSAPFVQKPAIEFPHQALFHPTRYLAGLLRHLRTEGVRIFEKSEATEIQAKPMAVKVGEHRIRCTYVVIATHTPLMGKTPLISATLLQTKLFLYTTYALSARISQDICPEASFFDTSDPYYYLRVDRQQGVDVAIFGGEDHKTGQSVKESRAYSSLERMFGQLFPNSTVDHRWSGQVVETPDNLPYIGETAPRQFVATGFAGNGMTFGTLGAMMAVDAFLKRANPWRELFDVHRKAIRGGAFRFLRENKDYPYYLVRDRLARGESSSVESVRRNTGKILQLKGHKVAAYRDPQGKVHLLSPICTHLQCIVRWNASERTWDCPCHGSRFAPTGQVLSGPAEDNLEPQEDVQ